MQLLLAKVLKYTCLFLWQQMKQQFYLGEGLSCLIVEFVEFDLLITLPGVLIFFLFDTILCIFAFWLTYCIECVCGNNEMWTQLSIVLYPREQVEMWIIQIRILHSVFTYSISRSIYIYIYQKDKCLKN